MKSKLPDNIKVGILGTRGIPNHYGGFEQFTEQLSQGLVHRGHKVSVYNSHFHPYKKKVFNGVEIIHRWDPKRIGLASQFIYDLLCILNARKKKFDVIIQLGYTTSSIWAWLLPKKAKIIYNMDGIEWKREKYKGLLVPFLKYAEKLAVIHSDIIIADAEPIKQYFDKKYNVDSQFIAYPATVFSNPDIKVLRPYNLDKIDYNLLIARFQPDNNLETIIAGIVESKTIIPLLIVGDNNNSYGRYLADKYNDSRIVFMGSIFDNIVLDNLRFFSNLYFHGHSAGGTNPSLLEAMATSCNICAHDNEFNRSVLGEDAYYFSNINDISLLLQSQVNKDKRAKRIETNLKKIRNSYNMDKIINKYQNLL